MIRGTVRVKPVWVSSTIGASAVSARNPPKAAPVLKVGVSRPPEAPLPRHIAVTSGFSTNKVRRSDAPLLPRNASNAMPFPLPNNWG